MTTLDKLKMFPWMSQASYFRIWGHGIWDQVLQSNNLHTWKQGEVNV